LVGHPEGFGLTNREATDRREARALVTGGSIPRWQTADRTSASRRSSGGMTVERCLSSVDGDAPGPYPGEDRSSRSRGSDTRVAKRQRRRLLSAPPQVRILPLVRIALARPLSPSASWPRPPPPQGGDQGSNPCGDAHPRGPTGTDAALRTRRLEVRVLPGVRASEHSSRRECRPEMPEKRLRLPPRIRAIRLLPEASGEAARLSTG
jgi:hypothetical protein